MLYEELIIERTTWNI